MSVYVKSAVTNHALGPHVTLRIYPETSAAIVDEDIAPIIIWIKSSFERHSRALEL
jgi:hypothetical protein